MSASENGYTFNCSLLMADYLRIRNAQVTGSNPLTGSTQCATLPGRALWYVVPCFHD